MINSQPETSDEKIVELIKQGDREQFGTLLARYEPKLERYGKKFLADRDDIVDIVQEVLISAYKNLQSFDSAQKFSSWIYRIAHNAFINELKRGHYRPMRLFDFDTVLAHVTYDDPAVTEREQIEMRKMIDKGLASISPKYKEVLILYYLEELDYQMVADVLQIPVGTVGIRLKRARKELKEVYSKMSLSYGK